MSFDKPHSVNEERSLLARWGLIAFSAFMALVWTALITADLGIFSPLLCALVAIGTAAGTALWTKPARGTSAEAKRDPSAFRYDLAALVLAASTLVFTCPPSEVILGGWDPGVYIHTAVEIARQGTLQFEHPDLKEIPEEDRGLLARRLGNISEPFGGMRLLPNGRVTPQFYHAYPALMAIAVKIGGLWAALGVNPIVNVFAILAFYAMVTGWTGSRRWGLAGALLLAVNPTQIWQARFSTAEMLTQLLLVAGMALLARWSRRPEDRQPEALFGGMALGLAQLTRYDTLIFLSIAIPILLWNSMDRRYRNGLFLALGAMGIAILHVWVHQRWIAPYYKPLGPIVGKAMLACAVVSVPALIFRATPPGKVLSNKLYRPLLWLVSAVWTLWMSFNWLVRPTLYARSNTSAAIREWFAAMNAGSVASILIGQNSRSMLFVESMFGPVALALALCGIIVLLWRAKTPAEHAWLWGGMGATLLLTWRPYNDLFMMWVSRRYIPVIIPWLSLGAVLFCAWLNQLLTDRFPRIARLKVPTVMILLAAVLLIPSSRHLMRHREWPGLVEWYEMVQSKIPQGAPVYTDQSGFSAPLRFIWQHRAYEVHHVSRRGRLEAFHTLLERAARRHGTVYLLTRRPPAQTKYPKVSWRLVAEVPLHSSMLRQTKHRIPKKTQQRGGPFVLYAIEYHESESP